MIEKQSPVERLHLLWIALFSAGILFALRVINLQILMHSYYKEISDRNRTQIIPQTAPRGRIFTRDGTAVATSKPSFSMVYFPQEGQNLKSLEKMARALSGSLNLSIEEFRTALYKSVKGLPVKLAEGISDKNMFLISEMRTIYSGINIITESRRFYPFGAFLSHMTGYIGKMEARDWEKYSKERDYTMDSRIGKSGLEKAFEKSLKGKDGGVYLEVDSKGRLMSILESRRWQPGSDIFLTVDFRIQKAAEDGLAGSLTGKGAVVAVDPRSGAILAFASTPDYDPNMYVLGAAGPDAERLKQAPEFNCAIQGTYAPGSAFKIVVAAAALELNKIKPEETFFCPGFYDAGSRIFRCWEKKGHGNMNFLNGIAHSCDVYFYNLGLKTGAMNIEKFSKMFRLGELSNVALAGEKAGNLFGPTRRLAKMSYWFIGDTLNLSIGQGELLATPMQLAQIASAVANRGTFWKPYFVDRVADADGNTVYKEEPEILSKVSLRPSTWDLLRDGLEKAVLEGTGRPAKIAGARVFGKTGTAQNPHGKDHAWFVAFAETDVEPSRIAVCVLVEFGEHGASSAAPIAKQVIEAALGDKNSDEWLVNSGEQKKN